ncbi:hypothetical protein ASE63_19990 [Bosea sp. Root381]|uniref:class I SAM-dependent methyltransferase n=1 Tax=Bosea sp. Root381 TaxID=1736524 RepID=UPI00071414F2|nr:class I SAM-dependent methyltransferase [Bosea sp. Root381]KRE12003.1 hypothetical protein ASE63_19990 [Bosea sp. Root381]
MTDLNGYLQGAYNQVHGWVYPGAVAALSACNRLSLARRAIPEAGSCEIGVHHGKFFLALLACTTNATRHAAVDVFEMQELNIDKSGLGSKEKFVDNLRRFHGTADDVELITADSLSIDERRVAQIEAGCGKFRLFSVDGGHTKIHARNDIRIAQSLIVSGGIVIVDDFFHPDWPGVTQGIYEYILYDCPKLAPVCIAGRKLFLTTLDAYPSFCQSLKIELYKGRKKSPVKDVDLFGYGTLSFELNPDDPIVT